MPVEHYTPVDIAVLNVSRVSFKCFWDDLGGWILLSPYIYITQINLSFDISFSHRQLLILLKMMMIPFI